MANDYRLINTLIAEVLDKATSDTSATWDDFYDTLSEDAKSGYADLIDWVCSYEDLERAEKYISVDDVMEAVVEFDTITAEDLIARIVETTIVNQNFAAENAEYERYLAECERADYVYDSMRDAKMLDED